MVTDEAANLKKLCNRVSVAVEAGCTLYLLEGLRLPPFCSLSEVDALLRPTSDGSYPSRLYFAQRISSRSQQNWNTSGILILNRLWEAFSWKVDPTGRTLSQIVLGHLEGLT